MPVEGAVAGAVHLWCDNRAVAIQAADHLVELGLQHFAFAGLDRAIWSLQRKDAFCRQVDEQGFAADAFLAPLWPSKKTQADHRKRLLAWLDALPKPVGVMACNDDFAMSLFELCRLHVIHVPEEVALIGVDNDKLICELTVPQLSSVAFATEQAGYEAAAALDRLMAGGATEDDIPVPAGRLVRRASTDVLAVEDEEVGKALHFIRLNAHRNISVGDVVEATFVSQWSLGRRFHRQLGHSIRKEIHRRRAEHIAGMLLATDMSVEQIAYEMGYPNQSHLARFFSREMGLTPREYRKR